MKPGYKQTEVGVIPEEWAVLPFGELAHIERGKFSARPRNDPKFYGGDIPFIQTGDVTNAKGQVTTFSQTLNSEGLKVSKMFPRGTLFFTIAANIGDVGIAAFDTACPDSLVAITPTKATDKTWLAYELAKRKSSFEGIATHNTQLNINLEKLRPYLLPHPPLHEQRAIAGALSDADELLGALDRLVAKKRDLKQAAMQCLLDGQCRLPGFYGEWERRRLGDIICRLPKTHRPAAEGQTSGAYPFFTNSRKACDSFLDEYDFDAEAVIANTGGEAFFNYYHGRFAAMADCLVLESKVVTKFLYFYLKTKEDIVNRIAFTGSGIRHLDKKFFSNISIKMPPTSEEQSAIATVLSEMEAEIALIELRREKTGALKKGMMQELLTGRTRLV